MKTRKDVIDFCLNLEDTYEDYPFQDKNWTLMRHKRNHKVFAWIFKRNNNMWINVKGSPEWCDFWRVEYDSVIPAYHMNKTYWNSIILDGTVPSDKIQGMIKDSYNITNKKIKTNQSK